MLRHSQKPKSTQGTTAAVAAVVAVAAVASTVHGGMDDGVHAHTATEHRDTPVVAAVTTATTTTSPARSNDSLEVQVCEDSARTSPSETQQQYIAEKCIE